MNGRALQVMVDFAGRKLGECPPEQQIPVYQALALTAPTARQRRTARRIALWLSRAAALQLEFHRQLARSLVRPASCRPFKRSVRPAGCRRHAAKGGRA